MRASLPSLAIRRPERHSSYRAPRSTPIWISRDDLDRFPGAGGDWPPRSRGVIVRGEAAQGGQRPRIALLAERVGRGVTHQRRLVVQRAEEHADDPLVPDVGQRLGGVRAQRRRFPSVLEELDQAAQRPRRADHAQRLDGGAPDRQVRVARERAQQRIDDDCQTGNATADPLAEV
jgi:hypothetical protein